MEASQLPGVRRGNGGESALELGVVVVCFLFLGGRGASQLPGVQKGNGGESALGLGVVVVCFLFLGGGVPVSFRVVAVVHKYSYITWLHRTERPSCWQGDALRLLLPETADWEAWWAAQQDVAHEIYEIAFSEEYALMCRDPLTPEGYRADLKQVRCYVVASDLGLLPELPPRHSFLEHDVYLEASGALPLPGRWR